MFKIKFNLNQIYFCRLFGLSCLFVLSLERENESIVQRILEEISIEHTHLVYLHHLVVVWNRPKLSCLFLNDNKNNIFIGRFISVIWVSGLRKHCCSCCGESWVWVCIWFVMLFNSSARSCVLILSFAMSSASSSFTSVWKGIEGSETVEVCFTCRLLAKSFF